MQIDYSKWIEAYEIDGNVLWAVMVNYPILFKYNIAENEMEYVSILPEKIWKDKECVRLFGDIYKYREYLYLVPVRADNVVKYDIRNNEFFSITVEDAYKADKYLDFYKSGMEKSVITMYSSAYKALVYINCENDEVIYDTNFINKLKEGMDGSDIMYFKTWSNQENHKLFMSQRKVKKFDNGKAEVLVEENEQEIEICNVILVENVIYAIIAVNQICKLMKYDIVQNKKIYFDVQGICNPHFISTIHDGDHLLFLPSNQGEKILRFHLPDEQIDFADLDGREDKFYAFANMKKNEKGFSVFEIIDGSFFIYEEDRWNKFKVDFNRKYSETIKLFVYKKSDRFLIENKELNLNDYMNIVLGKNDCGD